MGWETVAAALPVQQHMLPRMIWQHWLLQAVSSMLRRVGRALGVCL